MSRTTLLRWGGFSALFGWLYPVALYGADQVLHIPAAVIWLLSPLTIALLCLSFAGLHASQPVDIIGHLGFVLACLGGVAYFVGSEGTRLQWDAPLPLSWFGGEWTWDEQLIFKSWFLMGLGVLLLGIAISRAQSRRGRLPVILGGLLLSLWGMFDQSLSFNRAIWTNAHWSIVGGIILVVFALGWFRLGAQLVRAADAPTSRLVASPATA